MAESLQIHDERYRQYSGDRNRHHQVFWVLLRHGLRRCWASGWVKAATFMSVIPMLIFITGLVLVSNLSQAVPAEGETPPEIVHQVVRSLFSWQLWGFVTMISLGAGAGVIARDRAEGAFQFYFAKPVTPAYYMAGRIGALSLWCLLVTAIPTLLTGFTAIGLAPDEQRLSQLWVIPAALLYALTLAASVGILSVAVSAIHRSRTFTMTCWISLWILPHSLATIVNAIATTGGGEDWPWLYLLSLPALLGVIGDALLAVEPENALRWYYAAPVLSVAIALGLFGLHRGLRHAEVIR